MGSDTNKWTTPRVTFPELLKGSAPRSPCGTSLYRPDTEPNQSAAKNWPGLSTLWLPILASMFFLPRPKGDQITFASPVLGLVPNLRKSMSEGIVIV